MTAPERTQSQPTTVPVVKKVSSLRASSVDSASQTCNADVQEMEEHVKQLTKELCDKTEQAKLLQNKEKVLHQRIKELETQHQKIVIEMNLLIYFISELDIFLQKTHNFNKVKLCELSEVLEYIQGPQMFDPNEHTLRCGDCGTLKVHTPHNCPAAGAVCPYCKGEDHYSFRCLSAQQDVPKMGLAALSRSFLLDIIPDTYVSVLSEKFKQHDGSLYVTDDTLHRAYMDIEDEESGH